MTSTIILAAALRVATLDAALWNHAAWIADPTAPIAGAADLKARTAAPGTSWFLGRVTNAADVVTAKWMTTGLGVYELYLNGRPIGEEDALKPGFTHPSKTRRSFTYDITTAFRRTKGDANVLSAEVSSGWWRDGVNGYPGKRGAFRGVLELTYADGTKAILGTDTNSWRCVCGGPVVRAGIFDGEIHDARRAAPAWDVTGGNQPIVSTEFGGEILPTDGAEVCRRHDIALRPVEAYVWKGTTDAGSNVFGRVVKTRAYNPNAPMTIAPGDTLVIDFGQNCAAVPAFIFAAKPGVTLTCLPGETLNDANGERARGNDGPAGSLYRENLRIAQTCMRLEYTFATDRTESYMPRHTFFGYRYVSITADGDVTITSVRSVPVTSITKEMEIGELETGDKDVNRLIANVYWGQLSNYLSVPTDCPQRDERLGWTADTQVFCEAGAFNADTRGFFRKWTRDLRDTQGPEGGFPGVAPTKGEGWGRLRVGWGDAGVIVPYQIWKQFGDRAIIDENWNAMARFVDRLTSTKADHDANAAINGNYHWADWLSFEEYESCGGLAWENHSRKNPVLPEAHDYWNYLCGCYWLLDAQMMAEMARATGRDAAQWAAAAAEAKALLRTKFFQTDDGMIRKPYRTMQTPALFALKLGLVEGDAAAKTLAGLRANIKRRNGCLATGFLGTSILMDTLTDSGAADLAYDLLLNHNFPGWLYSVDQGATTIWERWNSYTKERGFGPVSMNSFNHYAYGAVLGWMYKTMAGIAADPRDPGYRTIVMAPHPDRRLGFVKARYRSAAGLVTSEWRYDGDTWIWRFSVPQGAKARVRLPGESNKTTYVSGDHEIKMELK